MILEFLLLLEIALSFGAAWLFVRWFVDSREATHPAVWVSVLTVGCAILPTFVLATDVESTLVRDEGEAAELHSLLMFSYHANQIALVLLIFLAIPFAFFYAEEENTSASVASRLVSALQLTSAVAAVAVVLLAIGGMLRLAAAEKEWGREVDMHWVLALARDRSTLSTAFLFLSACLTAVGFFAVVAYTGVGSAALLRDTVAVVTPSTRASASAAAPSLDAQRAELEEEASAAAEEKRRLLSRHVLTGARVPAAVQKRIEATERRQALLRSRTAMYAGAAALPDERPARAVDALCAVVLAVIRSVVQGLCIVLWVTLLASLAVGVVHKVAHGDPRVGLVVSESQGLLTPLDAALIGAAAFHPLDALLVAGTAAAALSVALRGVADLGVRLLWVPLFDLRRRATTPQGVLLLCLNVAFMSLAWGPTLHTAAPQYAAFGAQTFQMPPPGAANATASTASAEWLQCAVFATIVPHPSDGGGDSGGGGDGGGSGEIGEWGGGAHTAGEPDGESAPPTGQAPPRDLLVRPPAGVGGPGDRPQLPAEVAGPGGVAGYPFADDGSKSGSRRMLSLAARPLKGKKHARAPPSARAREPLSVHPAAAAAAKRLADKAKAREPLSVHPAAAAAAKRLADKAKAQEPLSVHPAAAAAAKRLTDKAKAREPLSVHPDAAAAMQRLTNRASRPEAVSERVAPEVDDISHPVVDVRPVPPEDLFPHLSASAGLPQAAPAAAADRESAGVFTRTRDGVARAAQAFSASLPRPEHPPTAPRAATGAGPDADGAAAGGPAESAPRNASDWVSVREGWDGREVADPLCRLSQASLREVRAAVMLPPMSLAFVFAQGLVLLSAICWTCLGIYILVYTEPRTYYAS